MFDVGYFAVLTFDNCVLKTGVIKWSLKLYVRFLRFFPNPKNMTFYVFLSCCTHFLEHSRGRGVVVSGIRCMNEVNLVGPS